MKTKNKFIEFGIAFFSIVGCFFTSSTENGSQLFGWYLYFLADIIGIYFFLKNKMWFLLFQFLFFLVISMNAIYQRIQ